MKEFGLIPSRKYSFVRFINIITYLTRLVLLRFTHPDSALPYTVMLGPVHPHSIRRGETNHEPFSILLHPPSDTQILSPSTLHSIILSLYVF